MDLQYLCEFLAVIECGSFTEAANKCCISQSSLSKHIIALERELDLKLIDREPKKIRATSAGLHLLPIAKTAQEVSNQIYQCTLQEKQKNKHNICLATMPEVAQYGLSVVLSNYRKEHPDVEFSISEFSRTSDIVDNLISGRSNLAFTRRFDFPPSIEYRLFRPDRIVAVFSSSHPLSSSYQLDLSSLCNEDFCLMDSSTDFYDLCISLCRTAGFIPHVTYTSAHTENVLSLVAQNFGISLLMERQVHFLNMNGITCVNIVPTINCPIYCIRYKSRPLLGNHLSFWQMLMAEIDSLTPYNFTPVVPRGGTWLNTGEELTPDSI